MKEIIAKIYVDEEQLKSESEDASFEGEMGWVAQSGISLGDYIENQQTFLHAAIHEDILEATDRYDKYLSEDQIKEIQEEIMQDSNLFQLLYERIEELVIELP